MDFEAGPALIAGAIVEVPVDRQEAGLMTGSVGGLLHSAGGSAVAF